MARGKPIRFGHRSLYRLQCSLNGFGPYVAGTFNQRETICLIILKLLFSILKRLMHEIKEHFGLQKEVPQKLSDIVQAFPDFLYAASSHGSVFSATL